MREILLLFLLIFLPIAHGGVEIWSVTVMHVVSLLVFTLWIYSLIRNGHIKLYRTPLDIPLLALIAFLIVSLFLSVYPYASRIQFYKIINYIVIFYVMVNILRDEKPLVLFTSYLAVLGALYGIAGLIFITGNFLGFRIFSSEDFLSFTFRNRNHFAGYMNMITFLCIGLAIYYNKTKRILFIGFATISAITVLLSLSRGGIIGFLSGFFFFLIISMIFKSRRSLYMISAFAVLIISVMFIIGSFDTVLERMMTLKEPELTTGGRLQIWKGALNMIKDNMVVGTGIGTFVYAYPAYQTLGGYKIDHAHNGYLEIISETGLVGGVLLFLCITILFGYVIRRSTSNLSGIGIGALSACLSLLAHEFSDFNLYIPSNALLFTVCCAIAIALSSILEQTPSAWIDVKLSGRRKVFYYLISSVMGLIFLALVVSPYLGAIYQRKSKEYQRMGDYERAYLNLKKAALFDHGNAQVMAQIGDLMVIRAVDIEEERILFLQESIKYYNKAIRATAVKSAYYVSKAYSLRQLGSFKEAEDALKKAVILNKGDIFLRYQLAELYLEKGNIGEALKEFRESVMLAQNHSYLISVLDRIWRITNDYNILKQVVPEDVRMRNDFADYLWKKGMKDAAVEEFAFIFSLEPSVDHALRHTYFLQYAERYNEAYEVCRGYLKQFSTNGRILERMAWLSNKVLSIAQLYCQEKRYPDAFKIINMVSRVDPSNAQLYNVMAHCYSGMGRLDDTIEAREKAVSLNPRNPHYLLYLGMEYWSKGRYEEAVEQWEKCLRIANVTGCEMGVESYKRIFKREGF